jgi:RNA polymerase sigma factor (sigma-70 family)
MVSHGSNSTNSDAALIARVRAGDRGAFGELWARHEESARRLARQLTKPANVDDLVSEAFARLLAALAAGGGPDGAFRPYLLSTLRNLHSDQKRFDRRQVSLGTDDERDALTPPAPSAADTALERADEQAAWRAWQSLPPTQRTVLWHLVVEEESPTTVARLLGTSPNGVSSRATRARERLRQAFLQQHIAAARDEQCAQVRNQLGAYVRGALSNRDRRGTDRHLARCTGCRASLGEIREVNETLCALAVPLELGAAGGRPRRHDA